MAKTLWNLRKEVRRRLYGFAIGLARHFSDTRRQQFVRDMIVGLVVGSHVHLTKIARALGNGRTNVHAVEKRLSRHLESSCWNMELLGEELLTRSAQMVGDDSLIVADTTDLSKPYAQTLEGLGWVRDGSHPEKRTTRGYMVWEAYVRVGQWQLFPLMIQPLDTYAGAAKSENEEILACVYKIHKATNGRGTWVLDRGFDRRELLLPMLEWKVAFIVRQRGDRHIRTADGQEISIEERAVQVFQQERPKRWPTLGWTYSETVVLPDAPEYEFLLVLFWRDPRSVPLMLLVSPQARRPGRNASWFVRAFRRRWGVEDATWGIKQRFCLEKFLVRSQRSIRRLLCLVAWAFFWLNLWGDKNDQWLCEAFLEHPWRLPKRVTYLFDWLATQISQFLHPRPKFSPNGYFDSG